MSDDATTTTTTDAAAAKARVIAALDARLSPGLSRNAFGARGTVTFTWEDGDRLHAQPLRGSTTQAVLAAS